MTLPERKLVTLVKPAFPTHKYEVGRKGKVVKYVVIHTTDARTLSSTVDWFGRHPEGKTSAHYLIGEQGEVVQFVSESDTAYHAGNYQMNLASIGIEHVGLSGGVFEPAQIEKSALLVAYICRGYKIPIENVIPHSSIQGTTHTGCPGPTFPWVLYRKLIKQYLEELTK